MPVELKILGIVGKDDGNTLKKNGYGTYKKQRQLLTQFITTIGNGGLDYDWQLILVALLEDSSCVSEISEKLTKADKEFFHRFFLNNPWVEMYRQKPAGLNKMLLPDSLKHFKLTEEVIETQKP